MVNTHASIKFQKKAEPDFYAILRKRVDRYFKDNKLKKTGNGFLYFKTLCMWVMYLTPYFLILFAGLNPWIMLVLAVLMGIGKTGIGFAIQHDANHGAYSRKTFLNKFLGLNLNFIGGSTFVWKIQHNVLHHTYTNIKGADEDIEAPFVLRLSPHSKWYFFHRFQHWYALFFYGMISMMWVLFDDVRQLLKYTRNPVNSTRKPSLAKEMAIMATSKILYLFYTVAIPLYILEIPLWQFFIGLIAMHYTTSILLSVIFQLAHIVGEAEQPLPSLDGKINNDWAIHQMRTTANFCRNNPVLSWYIGGLNFQIEHHLFTNISHVHYKSLSVIVRETAKEFNIPYIYFPTLWGALKSHFRFLKILGQNRAMPEFRAAA